MKTRLLLTLMVSIASLTFAAQSWAAPSATSSAYAARPGGSANSGNLGLGVMLGEPTGLTLKSWTSSRTAFDIGLSYSFGDYLVLLGDYLWHFPNAFSNATRGQVSSAFVPYVGIGALILFDADNNGRGRDPFFSDFDDEVAFGARIPLGIEFLPRSAPIGIFAELVPGVGLIPGVFGFLQGDVGARFYF